MQLKRFNVKEISSDPNKRRMLIAESTVADMAREGIDITLDQALESYDQIKKGLNEINVKKYNYVNK